MRAASLITSARYTSYSFFISARQCAKGDAYDVSARKPKFLKIGFVYRKFTRARTTVKLKHESHRALAARRAGKRHHRPALRRRELVRALVAERRHRGAQAIHFNSDDRLSAALAAFEDFRVELNKGLSDAWDAYYDGTVQKSCSDEAALARMGALAAIEHACVHLAGAASLADSADFESKGCVRSILDV